MFPSEMKLIELGDIFGLLHIDIFAIFYFEGFY